MKRRNLAVRSLLLLGVLATTIWTASSAHAQPEPLTIAAANSLRDVLQKILPLFEAHHPEVNVRVVYGPSQTLRTQIEQGAPVDVFLPSLLEEIEHLEKNGLVIHGTKRVYAGTSLVLITGAALPAPIASIEDLQTIPVRRIALGDPKTSAVGKVASQFLRSSRLDVRLKSQYVYGEHSRAVLDLVTKGEAELGIVYRSDAAPNPKVRILDTAPDSSHAPVRYGVAAVWTSKNLSHAGEFIEFLLTPQVQTLLQQYGFDRVPSKVGFTRRQEGK